MSLTLIGKKRGMTRLFDKKAGKIVPCTIIEVEPNVIMQVKTKETSGYTAIQLAAGSIAPNHVSRMRKPDLGQFQTRKLDPKKIIKESRIEDVSSYQTGQVLHIDLFEEGSFVDVRGKSKGKGYQGRVKRHNVRTMVQSHGVGPIERKGGSIGSVRGHGRVFKGKRMAGHMGDENVVVEKLEVIKVDTGLNALVVKGSVPGANGNALYIRKSIK